MSRITKFDELLPDGKIQVLIEKHAQGAEVWWQRTFSEVHHEIPGQTDTMAIPVTKIYLGMRGVLIGPEYYIWFAVTLDAVPSDEKLEKAISNALRAMQEQRACQAIKAN